MYVGAIKATYRIRGASCLKDKRRPLKSLKDRLSSRFNCAVAEVDSLDLWQRAVVGVSLVSGEESHLQSQLEEVMRYMELDPELELVDIDSAILSACDMGGLRDGLDY